MIIGPAIVDGQIFAIGITRFPQTLEDRAHDRGVSRSRRADQKTDCRLGRRLRPNREWQRRRSSTKDKFAPPHGPPPPPAPDKTSIPPRLAHPQVIG